MADDMSLPPFDRAKLIADIRAGDEASIVLAYHLTFDGDMGRLVLAHFLVECGVGRPIGIGENARQDAYATGKHDAALALAERAKVDQAAIVVAHLSDSLEENNHGSFDHPDDGNRLYDGDGEPEF